MVRMAACSDRRSLARLRGGRSSNSFRRPAQVSSRSAAGVLHVFRAVCMNARSAALTCGLNLKMAALRSSASRDCNTLRRCSKALSARADGGAGAAPRGCFAALDCASGWPAGRFGRTPAATPPSAAGLPAARSSLAPEEQSLSGALAVPEIRLGPCAMSAGQASRGVAAGNVGTVAEAGASRGAARPRLVEC